MEADITKINKLTGHLKALISSLNELNDINLHRTIDQFYYMQKLEELRILKRQYEEAQKLLESIQVRMTTHYYEIGHQWSKDARQVVTKTTKLKQL